jgi:hypothetical protein
VLLQQHLLLLFEDQLEVVLLLNELLLQRCNGFCIRCLCLPQLLIIVLYPLLKIGGLLHLLLNLVLQLDDLEV